MKKIKWGIIGCGNVTEVKSGPPYQLTQRFELVAVMRRDGAKVRDYAERHNVPKFYTDADLLINDPEVDAIYIATPPHVHKRYALKVADSGKPCCVEKPFGVSYKDSIAITKAYAKRSIPLFVAYYRRSLPRFLKIKDWIDNDKIGKIESVHWEYHRTPSKIDLSEKPNWRTNKEIAPGGYFDDLASHGLDLFIYFFGNVTEAKGKAENKLGLYSAYDSITGNWKHKDGIRGSGIWNFGPYEYKDEVVIIGKKGQIEFSVFDDKPIALIQHGNRKEINIDHPKHVQQFHVENISRHLFEESFIHPSTGETATHTHWVMDKILGKI